MKKTQINKRKINDQKMKKKNSFHINFMMRVM